jgi:hypothetical protein
MDRLIEDENELLLVVDEGEAEDIVNQLCICSIFMDIPGKMELLCESARAAAPDRDKRG